MKALLNSLRRFSLTGVMVLARALGRLQAVGLLHGRALDPRRSRAGRRGAGCARCLRLRHRRARQGQPAGPTRRRAVPDRSGTVRHRAEAGRSSAAGQARACSSKANADLKRYSALTPDVVVSKQRMDQVVATQGAAQAAYDQAVADLALAKLNLERSEVRASVNGIVTNMELRPGTYLTPGKGVMALLDSDTLHVEGYFEETKLLRIHVGDAVNVRLHG